MNKYNLQINGKSYEVCIGSVSETSASVTVNGIACEVGIEKEKDVPAQTLAESPAAAAVAQSAPVPAGKGSKITSPLPGVIIEISVKEGDQVAAGQKVAVLEAMKMENEIQAETSGVVTRIHVSRGDSVLEGADIVSLG